MTIPDFQSIMLPLLELAADGELHSMREARERLGEHFALTAEERKQLLPSGRQATFDNRVAWAKSYLLQAGLVESPKRGLFRITQRGRGVLEEAPERLSIGYLERFPEFVEFRSASAQKAARSRREKTESPEPETPEEIFEQAYQSIRDDLSVELLRKVKDVSPQSFEHLVVELLLRMGYGGSRREAGEAIGRSGDEGIDGIIREDRLGLDVIYLQAKRWNGSVGRPEIQKFVGALHGKQARKGVFITTGLFSSEAVEYVAHLDPKVVLIDGEKLADLMIDHDLGVTTIASYELKRLDSDYFAEE